VEDFDFYTKFRKGDAEMRRDLVASPYFLILIKMICYDFCFAK